MVIYVSLLLRNLRYLVLNYDSCFLSSQFKKKLVTKSQRRLGICHPKDAQWKQPDMDTLRSTNRSGEQAKTFNLIKITAYLCLFMALCSFS